MANLAELGDAFIRHYYTVFATNRQAIGTLYVRPHAWMPNVLPVTSQLTTILRTARVGTAAHAQQPNSTMCFEGETRIGQQAIIEKLSVQTEKPFRAVGAQTDCPAHRCATPCCCVPATQQLPNMQHEIITKDVLEGVVPGSVLISVTGRFAMEGDLDKPMFFTQTFMLMPLPGNAGYYVQNDIFRRVSIA